MKRINKAWSIKNAGDLDKFIKRVEKSDAFFARLNAFEAKLDAAYQKWWVAPNATTDEAGKVFKRLDGRRKVARFKTGEGSRLLKLLPQLLVALKIFDIIGEGVAVAANAGGHTPYQEGKWQEFEFRYRRALDVAVRTEAPPDKREYLVPLKDAFIKYLRAIEIPDKAVSAIDAALEVYLADQ